MSIKRRSSRLAAKRKREEEVEEQLYNDTSLLSLEPPPTTTLPQSNKQQIKQKLIKMGFPSNYMVRAFKVYEKNYGNNYNTEVVTDIIVRLQNKDRNKKANKDQNINNFDNMNRIKPLAAPEFNQNKAVHNSMENKHFKSQSNQFKPMTRSSLSVPPIFKVKDIVIYNGIQSEINRIRPDGLIEISYPISQFMMQRKKATVNNKQIQAQKKNTISGNNNTNIPPFTPHMSLNEANKLRIHDKIDHRDQVGRFVYATVLEKQGTNLKIHYDGWNRKWDTWSDYNLELHRFAVARSISNRPAHRFRELRKGSYCDVNPTRRYPGWRPAEIRRLDQKSGQVQVVYEDLNKKYLYWAHFDDENEIAAFTSKSGTVHSTQMETIVNPIIDNLNGIIQSNSTRQQLKDIGSLNINEKPNNSKPNNRKRKLSEMSEPLLESSMPVKRMKLMNNNNDCIEYKKQIEKLKQQIKTYALKEENLKQENKTLKQRLDLLKWKSEKIKGMDLNELNELKIGMQKKIKLIEEAEKELIDNTYKCVACMDNIKNISFIDGCGHVALCDECEKSMEKKCCPICQKPYTNVKKIHF